MKRDGQLLQEQKEDMARLKILCLGARKGMWTWPTTGAMCGLVGCAVAAAFGMLLLTLAWAMRDESSGLSLHGIGSILLLATIPLLILGACCLDLVETLEEKKKNQRSTPKDTEEEASLNSHAHLPIAMEVDRSELPIDAHWGDVSKTPGDY